MWQLDDKPSSEQVKDPAGKRKSRPRLVNCRPWPPLEEVENPQRTGIFYYGIYCREKALEQLAIRLEPRLADESPGSLLLYGINAARWVAGDPSLEVQFGYLRPRHKEAMPFITEESSAPILCLFELGEEAFAKRMEAEKVERLARELDCKPDWYELAFLM